MYGKLLINRTFEIQFVNNEKRFKYTLQNSSP